jgi:putative ABC transport system permease protein
MIGIIISIGILVLLVSISIGLQNAVQEQFRLLGTDKFFIQPKGQLGGPGSGGAVTLTTQDVDVIKKVIGVKDISYFVMGSAQVEFARTTRYVFATGMPLDDSNVLTEQSAYVPIEGRLLEKGDRGKVMVGNQYSQIDLFKKRVNVGDNLLINGKQFKVKGILKTTGSPPDDRAVYLPVDDFKELFNSSNRVDQILVQVSPGEKLADVADRVKHKLKNSRGVTDKTIDFQVLTPEELLSSFGQVLSIITGFLLSVAAISLLVGGIGITNTMYTSVLERTREIGVMKAIGARNRDILTLFVIEAGLLGLVGGIMGVGIGFGIAKIIQVIAVQQLKTNLLQAATPWWLALGAVIFSTLVGSAAGALPAWRASKLRAVDALRYE